MTKSLNSFILAEPTTGFPRFSMYKKLVSSELSDDPRGMAIINMNFNSLLHETNTVVSMKTEPSAIMSKFLGVTTYNICSFFEPEELSRIELLADKEVEELFDIALRLKGNYRTLKWQNTWVGLYIASSLYRSYPSLCIPGHEASKEMILRALKHYTYSALALKKLKEKVNIAAILATHDIYFWGFITEYAATIGIPSLTYLGGFKPTIKTKALIDKRNNYGMSHRTIPENQLFFSMKKDPEKENQRTFIHQFLANRSGKAPIETYTTEEQHRVLTELESYSKLSGNIQRLSKVSLGSERFQAPSLLLCMHSFNDANFDWGYSGYDTIWEYFITIVKQSVRHCASKYTIIIRPHPDVFNDWGDYDSIQYDREINHLFLKEVSSLCQSVLIAGPDISMAQLLQKQNIIPVTHHSYNIALEAALHKTRCITGNCNPIMLHHKYDLDVIEDDNLIEAVIKRSFRLRYQKKACMDINSAIDFAVSEFIDPLLDTPSIDNVWSRPWAKGKKRLGSGYLEKISNILDKLLTEQRNAWQKNPLICCDSLLEVLFEQDRLDKLAKENELIINRFVERIAQP